MNPLQSHLKNLRLDEVSEQAWRNGELHSSAQHIPPETIMNDIIIYKSKIKYHKCARLYWKNKKHKKYLKINTSYRKQLKVMDEWNTYVPKSAADGIYRERWPELSPALNPGWQLRPGHNNTM